VKGGVVGRCVGGIEGRGGLHISACRGAAPLNQNILLCCYTIRVYRSADSGNTWTLVLSVLALQTEVTRCTI